MKKAKSKMELLSCFKRLNIFCLISLLIAMAVIIWVVSNPSINIPMVQEQLNAVVIAPAVGSTQMMPTAIIAIAIIVILIVTSIILSMRGE
jgi:hypothetical protein